MAEKLFCSSCQQEKNTNQFYRHKRNKGRGYTYKCKACISLESKEKYQNEKEVILQKSNRYYQNRREEINKKKREKRLFSPLTVRGKPKIKPKRARRSYRDRIDYWAKYRASNRERIRLRQKNYRANPENRNKTVIWNQQRRFREKGAGGSYTQEQWKRLCSEFDNRCVRCNQKTKLTVDHITPLIEGGSNHISNIQPLCSRCNSTKHTKIIDYRPFVPIWTNAKAN